MPSMYNHTTSLFDIVTATREHELLGRPSTPPVTDKYHTENNSHWIITTVNIISSSIQETIVNATNLTNSDRNISIIKEQELCTSPAYHEFPTDAFTQDQRDHGAIIVHILAAIYMFIALAIVCDEYFVTSLDKICQKLGMNEDIAGATFMAAGSSAPELCTAIIGVFITKGDVGIGTIVGSAVFNILFVIGVCGVMAGQVIVLSWWSLCRDASYYALAVIVLILVVFDGEVTWYESLIMLVLYIGYIVVMRFNTTLQAIVCRTIENIKTSNVLPMNGHVKPFTGDYEVFNDDDDDVFTGTGDYVRPNAHSELPADEYAKATKLKPHFCDFIWRLMMMKRFKPKTRFMAAAFLIISYKKRMEMDVAYQKRQQFRKMAHKSSVISYTRSIRGWFNLTTEGDDLDWWKRVPSTDDGIVNVIKWSIQYPLRFCMYYTVPDCRRERWERWYMGTFVASIVWIAILSYIMVWMVTFIGFTFNIPDSIMGITFLAAGTSIPDAMASVFVAKQGMGDMAVSNSLGSNVFDILLGLSVPWFLKTGVVYAGTTVAINSRGMLYSIILLFMTVFITVGTIRYTGWKLNRKVGIIFLVSYAIYVTISSMIECNVMGFVNPPMCEM